MRLWPLLFLAGCPKNAPVATPEAPPAKVEHTLTFAWPDGAWGYVERVRSLQGVSLKTESDVGVSRAGEALHVTESVRLQSVLPEGTLEVPDPLLEAAWFDRISWTWSLDETGARVEHASRRDAAAPLYDPQEPAKALVEELWYEPEHRAGKVEAVVALLPSHESYEAARDGRRAPWNAGLPMLHGRTLVEGVPVEAEGVTWVLGADVPCGPRDKFICAVVDLDDGQRRSHWVVDPATLLPWSVSITQGELSVQETWSWTIR